MMQNTQWVGSLSRIRNVWRVGYEPTDYLHNVDNEIKGRLGEKKRSKQMLMAQRKIQKKSRHIKALRETDTLWGLECVIVKIILSPCSKERTYSSNMATTVTTNVIDVPSFLTKETSSVNFCLRSSTPSGSPPPIPHPPQNKLLCRNQKKKYLFFLFKNGLSKSNAKKCTFHIGVKIMMTTSLLVWNGLFQDNLEIQHKI